MKRKASEENPWVTRNSELVYESPWISLTKHEVINPSGNPGTYSVVHFKGLAIGVIALDEKFNTWLVGQYRFPIEKYSWEIPEGGGDLNTPPLDSAKRELLEETGITAKKWTKIQEMHMSNSATDEYCFLYVAQDLSFQSPKPDEDERLELKKIHFDDFYDMVQKGEITDSLSVVAAYKVKLMIDNGKLKRGQ